MESRTSHCWNNQASTKNSKWLFDNLKVMDQLFCEMLKLVEDDGDSFAKKAAMYYQRRPELISHVKEFYRMYQALALRYVNATGDLAKNVDQIQSQCSVNSSEFSIEGASVSSSSSPMPTSEYKVHCFKPHWRAAGFDFSLGSNRSSDCSRKESDESSSESSEYDYNKSIDGYDNSTMLEARIVSTEDELHGTKSKLQEHKNEFKDFPNSEILDFPEIRNLSGTMEANAKQFDVYISHKDHVIREYKSWIGAILSKYMEDKSQTGQDEQFADEKSRLEIKILEQEQMIMELQNKFLQEKSAMEAKVSSLMVSTNCYEAKLQILERRVKQLETEKSALCSRSEKRITELNQSLEDSKLRVAKLTSKRDELKVQIRARDDETSERLEESKIQVADLSSERDELKVLVAKLRDRDGDCSVIGEHLPGLNKRDEKLLEEDEEAQKSATELRDRVLELEVEVERQRALVVDGAEGKREAIRQLCFSIEHYRMGYQQLWKMLRWRNRRPAMIMAT